MRRTLSTIVLGLLCAATFPAAATGATPDGATLFERHCALCHAAGDGHPGTMRLAQRLGTFPLWQSSFRRGRREAANPGETTR